MVRLRRERWIAVGGILAGLLGGVGIVWAGFGGFTLWLILIFVIPVLLCAVGARAIYTFVLAGISLMTPVQVHSLIFEVRSGYYTAYGIRWEDIVNTCILWGGSLGVSIAMGLVVSHFASRGSTVHTTG